MPLFSFSKKAGADTLRKATPTKSTTVGKVAIDQAADQKATVDALRAHIQLMDLKIKDLDLQVQNDHVTVYGQADSQATKEKVILALGNVEGIAGVDDRISVVTPEPQAQFYEVQAGDSLSKIAKKYYGDAQKYNTIFEANQPLLKDPNKIYPGQMLRIPNK